MATNKIITPSITDLAVTTAKIADGNVTTDKIDTLAVTTAKIADGNVTTGKIADGDVTTGKIADGNVTTGKIDALAVTTAKIADGNVTTGKIDAIAVTTGKIDDLAVTTGKIDDLAVTTAKIADGDVTTGKIDDLAVTTAKIADGNVTTAKIADGNVTTAKIADGDVTTGKIDFGHDDLDGFLTNEHIDWTTSGTSVIHADNLPPIALTTVQIATDQNAHLGLTAEEGDIVVRSDENKTYCHNGGSVGTMADYTVLATPTDNVLSVNGQTGAVNIETFTSGTKMVFYQASAPTGWTQDFENGDAALRVINTALTSVTSSTALDTLKVYKILELGNTDFTAFGAGSNTVGVSFKPTQTAWPTAANGDPTSGKLTIGSGGASGGTASFSTLTHTHTRGSLNVTGHSLTESEMPKHYHRMKGPNSGSVPQGGVTGYSNYGGGTPDDGGWLYGTYSVGGSAGSNSTATGTGTGNSHDHAIDGSVDSTNISPKYIDVIVCIKD